MSERRFPFAVYIALLFLLPPIVCSQSLPSATLDTDSYNCTPFCGKINISSPFRLRGDPQICGNQTYELSCEENRTRAVLYLYSGKYYVQAINYENLTIRVVDAAVQKEENYYSDPRYALARFNFSESDPYTFSEYGRMMKMPWLGWGTVMLRISLPLTFLNCENPIKELDSFVETTRCVNKSSYSSRKLYSYITVGLRSSFELGESCTITQMALLATPPPIPPSLWPDYWYDHQIDYYLSGMSCEDLYKEIAHGFQLSWIQHACEPGCGFCLLNDASKLPDCKTSS